MDILRRNIMPIRMLIEPKKTQKKRILSVILRLFLSKSVLFEFAKLPV